MQFDYMRLKKALLGLCLLFLLLFNAKAAHSDALEVKDLIEKLEEIKMPKKSYKNEGGVEYMRYIAQVKRLLDELEVEKLFNSLKYFDSSEKREVYNYLCSKFEVLRRKFIRALQKPYTNSDHILLLEIACWDSSRFVRNIAFGCFPVSTDAEPFDFVVPERIFACLLEKANNINRSNYDKGRYIEQILSLCAKNDFALRFQAMVRCMEKTVQIYSQIPDSYFQNGPEIDYYYNDYNIDYLHSLVIPFRNLGMKGIESMSERMKRYRDNKNSIMTKNMLLCLGYAGDTSVSEELSSLIQDENEDIAIRGVAIKAYSTLMQEKSIPVLQNISEKLRQNDSLPRDHPITVLGVQANIAMKIIRENRGDEK